MAEIISMCEYRKKKEAEAAGQTYATEEELPNYDEIAVVMMMSSDELFVELLARVEYGESLRDDVISTTTLISELTNRALHMELLCEMATELGK